MDEFSDKVRILAEQCDGNITFMYYSAMGASMANFGLEQIAMLHPKCALINLAQMPDLQPGSASGGIEIQNFVQSFPEANEHSSAIIPVTKSAIYENMLAHMGSHTT